MTRESISITRSRYALALGLTVLGGCLLLVVCTQWGVGISPDSTVYLGAARNVIEGHGPVLTQGDGSYIPLTKYPPLYPMALAVVGLSGADLAQGARQLNFGLFISTTLLIAFTILSYTRSRRLSLLASIIFVTSEIALEPHAQVLSEPLFVFLGLAGLYLLSAYLGSRKVLLLLAATTVIGLAFLTRYVGGALVVACALGVLMAGPGAGRSLMGVLVVLIGAGGPGAIWVLRNLDSTGQAANRMLAFHPPSLNGADSVQLLIPIAFVLGMWRVARRPLPKATERPSVVANRYPALLTLYILVYVSLLVVAITFFDASIPVSNRTLAPVYVSMLVLGFCTLPGYLRIVARGRIRQGALIAFGAVIVTVHVVNGTTLVTDFFNNGSGYSSPAWRKSKLLAYVNEMEANTPIFTNGPDVLFALTGRNVFGVPEKTNPMSRKPNPEFKQQVLDLSRQLAANRGVLIYFRNLDRSKRLSEAELTASIPLQIVLDFEGEGALYVSPSGTVSNK